MRLNIRQTLVISVALAFSCGSSFASETGASLSELSGVTRSLAQQVQWQRLDANSECLTRQLTSRNDQIGLTVHDANCEIFADELLEAMRTIRRLERELCSSDRSVISTFLNEDGERSFLCNFPEESRGEIGRIELLLESTRRVQDEIHGCLESPVTRRQCFGQ